MTDKFTTGRSEEGAARSYITRRGLSRGSSRGTPPRLLRVIEHIMIGMQSARDAAINGHQNSVFCRVKYILDEGESTKLVEETSSKKSRHSYWLEYSKAEMSNHHFTGCYNSTKIELSNSGVPGSFFRYNLCNVRANEVRPLEP